MKRITDPSFRYYNAASTDLRRTFRRVRREQAIVARDASTSPKAIVTPINNFKEGCNGKGK